MKIFEFLANQSERRPWLVVAVVALITVFLLAGIPRLSTELSQEAMMPKNYESVQSYQAVKEKFGGVSYQTILVTADDVTDPEMVRVLFDLSPEKTVEAGMEEGQILKVETYLDFIKYQLPEMMKAAGMEVPLDASAVNDAMLEQFMEFYLNPDPDSPFLEFLTSVSGNAMPEETKKQFVSVFTDNAERVKKNFIRGGQDGNPPYVSMLVNFQINPNLSQNQLVELGKKFKDFIAGEFGGMEGVETYISGNASMQMESQEFMRRETSKLMGIALLFVMLILYLTFRRFSDVALPLLIIFVAIFWIIGLMGWVGITYTTMSVAVMPLMLGINIAYVIHILSRYYEEREDGLSVDLSATTAIKTVGVAVFLTAITTLFGFSSFMITDIPPMRDFGLLCMLGIAFSFLLSLTLLPAIVVIRDRSKKEEKRAAHLEKMRARRRDARYGAFIDNALVRMAMVAEHHHWTVAVVTVVLVALGIFAVFNVKTGADVNKMMPEGMPSREASSKITKIFGPQNSDIILVEVPEGGNIYEPANLAALLAMEDSITMDPRNRPGEDDYFNREKITSIADYILLGTPDGQLPQTLQGVEEVVARLRTRMPLDFLLNEVDKGGEKVATAAMVNLKSSFPETEDELEVKSEIMRDHSAEVMETTDMELRSTGMSVLIADLLRRIVPTQLETSGLALLLCLLVLILVFKSFTYGLVTLVVVVCGMMAEIVFIYAIGWPLDIMTVMVASLVIGAGVDFGIHITHRFRDERHGGELGTEESIRETVKNVGRALVAAALTTCGVFAILGFSKMAMMQRFGWATAVGLLGALFGAVLVLPSVLAIVAKRRKD